MSLHTHRDTSTAAFSHKATSLILETLYPPLPRYLLGPLICCLHRLPTPSTIPYSQPTFVSIHIHWPMSHPLSLVWVFGITYTQSISRVSSPGHFTCSTCDPVLSSRTAVHQVCALDRQHWHHLGTYLKCKFLGLNLDHWIRDCGERHTTMGPAICALTRLPGGSVAGSDLRTLLYPEVLTPTLQCASFCLYPF